MKSDCDNEMLKTAVLPQDDDVEMARLAQALGHPARVAIVRLLRGREVCICGEIVELLPLAQSTVSQHLKVLKDAGWIESESDGTRVCYNLSKDTVQRFNDLIDGL